MHNEISWHRTVSIEGYWCLGVPKRTLKRDRIQVGYKKKRMRQHYGLQKGANTVQPSVVKGREKERV